MYIRTKDGVFELVDTYYMCVDGVETYMYDNNGRGVEIRGSQILKQSENLEELCDEFVCEWFDKKVNRYRHVYCSFKIGQSKELYRRDIPLPADVDFEIYAGIWVNGKGLTYVAKMNDKGKLELI